MSKKIKPGLGKGLGALLPSIEISEKGFKFTKDEFDEDEGNMAMLEVGKITHNPYQPRKDFDEQALEDLKNSIIEHGVIQPVTVRPSVTGYELIAGERRLRAAIAANLKKIPAYIIDVESDIAMLELALIENVQRENLNPIEIANGYQRLIEECSLTQEQVAAKVGKDRTTVTNFLRLLRLPEIIQESIRNKELTMGHARALLALSDKNNMLLVWKEIVEKAISVRGTEKLVKDVESGIVLLGDSTKEQGKKEIDSKRKDGKPHLSAADALVLADREKRLRHIFGTQVKIQTKSRESGSIEFDFYSKDDLERLLDLFSSIDPSK